MAKASLTVRFRSSDELVTRPRIRGRGGGRRAGRPARPRPAVRDDPRAGRAGDRELQIAGLVHDVGTLLPPGAPGEPRRRRRGRGGRRARAPRRRPRRPPRRRQAVPRHHRAALPAPAEHPQPRDAPPPGGPPRPRGAGRPATATRTSRPCSPSAGPTTPRRCPAPGCRAWGTGGPSSRGSPAPPPDSATHSAGKSSIESSTWVCGAASSVARSCAPVRTPATTDVPAHVPASRSLAVSPATATRRTSSIPSRSTAAAPGPGAGVPAPRGPARAQVGPVVPPERVEQCGERRRREAGGEAHAARPAPRSAAIASSAPSMGRTAPAVEASPVRGLEALVRAACRRRRRPASRGTPRASSDPWSCAGAPAGP